MKFFPAQAGSDSSFDLSRLLRRLTVAVFALIQAVLVARILLDIGLIPADSGFGETIISLSDFLAAPVQGVGNGLNSMFGGTGLDSMAGEGFNSVMLVALVGWSVVEGLVMRVVRKFDEV